MAYVRTVPIEEAEGAVREQYEADRAARGYVPNYSQLFSLRPDVYAAWRGLIGAISKGMDLRRYELATVAAAAALRSRYCVAAHMAILESKFFTRAQIEAIAHDYRNAGLDPVDVAIMALAEKVALRADRVTAADIDELRRHGLSDRDIFDVVLAAAARAFFSKTLDALGASPDPAMASTATLLDLFAMPRG